MRIWAWNTDYEQQNGHKQTERRLTERSASRAGVASPGAWSSSSATSSASEAVSAQSTTAAWHSSHAKLMVVLGIYLHHVPAPPLGTLRWRVPTMVTQRGSVAGDTDCGTDLATQQHHQCL